MEWSDSALVLGMGRFREADLWVRLLTRRHGIVSAFAFGGSRSRRRFAGCLDLFNELQISTRSTGNGMYLALLEARLLQGPRRLRTDWRRVGMFMNCVRFLEAFGVSSESSPAVFRLMKRVFEVLEEAEQVSDIFPVFFRLRLASEDGYAPSLGACAQCGCEFPSSGGLLVSEGALFCSSCLQDGHGRGTVSSVGPEALATLRTVQAAEPSCWPVDMAAGPFSSAARQECARAIDGFVQYHLGLIWDRGRFRRG